jgi:hypothetical protein
MWRKWYNTYILCELGAKYIMSALTKIFGTHSDRELKRITPLVDKVESYRDEMKALSDEELRGKTKEYKERLEKGETLDDLLPEAYATVREAASRVLGMEHYRVQIIGGIILHQGRIAEMKTGEGKTLVSTLPAYLNALEDINKRIAIAATRRVYKALGKDPNRYRPSAEALCRRIVRDIPVYRVSLLVDIINLVSIRSGFSIGGFDLTKIQGDLRLGVGTAEDEFEAIGRGLLNIEGLPVYRDAVG